MPTSFSKPFPRSNGSGVQNGLHALSGCKRAPAAVTATTSSTGIETGCPKKKKPDLRLFLNCARLMRKTMYGRLQNYSVAAKWLYEQKWKLTNEREAEGREWWQDALKRASTGYEIKNETQIIKINRKRTRWWTEKQWKRSPKRRDKLSIIATKCFGWCWNVITFSKKEYKEEDESATR